MTHNGVVAAGGRLTDWISLGVLASSVSRDAVDKAVVAAGRAAKRSDGKLPPHVMVYFAMALALFAEEDYEEVAARLTETLASWGCWDESWSVPTSGGITQARQRLGPEPLALLFDRVAVPVAGLLTRGAFLRAWRLMAIDGFELDVPDTAGQRGGVRVPRGRAGAPGVPEGAGGDHRRVRLAREGRRADGPGRREGQQRAGPGPPPVRRLEEDWLLIADRGFYNWPDWQAAAATGAALLWRVKNRPAAAGAGAAARRLLPVGRGQARPARQGPGQADRCRPRGRAPRPGPGDAGAGHRIRDPRPRRRRQRRADRLDHHHHRPRAASAQELAQAYCQRWEEETGNDQLKTCLRGPGSVLRSKSPDMVRQEIYGYLLTHYAISALICQAATEADIDPDRVKFLRTVRIIRRRAADPAFPP